MHYHTGATKLVGVCLLASSLLLMSAAKEPTTATVTTTAPARYEEASEPLEPIPSGGMSWDEYEARYSTEDQHPEQQLWDIWENGSIVEAKAEAMTEQTTDMVISTTTIYVPLLGKSIEKVEYDHLLETLTKVVFTEARGESENGKIGVAATVLNRMASPNFPETVEDVLLGEYYYLCGVPEYAPIDWITPLVLAALNPDDAAAWQECKAAAKKALDGEDPFAEELGAPTLFFYNPSTVSWGQLEKRAGITQVMEDDHAFHHTAPRWN